MCEEERAELQNGRDSRGGPPRRDEEPESVWVTLFWVAAALAALAAAVAAAHESATSLFDALQGM